MATAKRGLAAALHHEAAPGIILLFAAILALVLDNSPLAFLYDALLNTPFRITIGELDLHKPLLLWINDGLMAVFFLLVGLEIKRELVIGRLSTVNQAVLPALAAVGGMAIPALIYVGLNSGDPDALAGWAIPAATDIAFALGVLAILGSRVPPALKVFLLALAIIDDLGAILIIAVFYTSELSTLSLALAGAATALLVVLNLTGVRRVAPYALVGIVLWVCVLKSGVHATLAGVVLAFCIPMTGGKDSLLVHLEHDLHPWVAFMIMPVFAFANAGVSLAGLSFADLLAPVPLGIALGLFFGKQIGVVGFTWGACRLGLCRLPTGVGWMHIYGASLLAGIGFTMSLFIGALAFSDPALAADVRLGVLSGSTVSAICGFIVLRFIASAAEPQPVVAPAADAVTDAEATGGDAPAPRPEPA